MASLKCSDIDRALTALTPFKLSLCRPVCSDAFSRSPEAFEFMRLLAHRAPDGSRATKTFRHHGPTAAFRILCTFLRGLNRNLLFNAIDFVSIVSAAWDGRHSKWHSTLGSGRHQAHSGADTGLHRRVLFRVGPASGLQNGVIEIIGLIACRPDRFGVLHLSAKFRCPSSTGLRRALTGRVEPGRPAFGVSVRQCRWFAQPDGAPDR